MKRVVALLLSVLIIAGAALCMTGCEKGDEKLRSIVLNEVTRSVFYAPL